MESYSLVAPLIFIIFHIIRPLFLLPVLLLCITGGLLFGMLAGTLYSVIGLMISSIIFYFIIHILPVIQEKCKKLEDKLLGNKLHLTTIQIILLRMLPFIHFHLISFCIYQKTGSFPSYLRTTFFSILPVTILYTTLGNSIIEISAVYSLPLILLIIALTFLLRKKEVIIKWNTFFSRPTT